MNNMMQGMQLLKMVSDMNKRGSGPTPTGLPDGMPDFLKQGVIGKLMSDNPGGLIGALRGNPNAPVNPGSPPPPGSPDYVPGGQGPMAGGAPAGGGMTLGDILPSMGMLGKAPMGGGAAPGASGPGGSAMPLSLNGNSSADDIWNSYKAAGGGADVSNSPFVRNSQNFGSPMFNMQQGIGGGLNALRSFFGGGG